MNAHLAKQDAWVGYNSPNALISNIRPGQITLLRKADASLNAELLQMWCQILTRGKLDEDGRYSKFDEATWEKLRQELALQVEANTDAQVLRSAVTDRLYWLRQEIEGASAPLPLLDRLIVAEPTWTNYDRRAGVHAGLGHWFQAIRDELEATRLLGDGYWRNDGNGGISSTLNGRRNLSQDFDWSYGDHIVKTPGRPREQYELALRWAEARSRAGVVDTIKGEGARRLMIGLAQFRLGRYADSLATLQKRDVPKLCHAAGMLMSLWNLLTIINPGSPPPGSILTGPWRITQFPFDSMDLAVRAMCHHHLGQPKEAAACLQQTRELLGKAGGSPEQRALLHEAETLIEGKARP